MVAHVNAAEKQTENKQEFTFTNVFIAWCKH